MSKLPENMWQISGLCLKLYIKNFHKFSLYMLFPVLGQIISACVVIGFAVVLGNNADIWAIKYPIFNNFVFTFSLLMLVTIPFMVIMLKAVWDYIVAYGALNSMADAVLNTNKLYDFKAHKQMVTNHLGKFLLLLLIISVYFLFAVNPLFWIICGILFVYFILLFQVFIFEQELNVIEIFKKSFTLIKGNFAKTFILTAFAGIFLYAVYYLLLNILSLTKINGLCLGMFETFAMTLPISEINSALSTFKMQEITQLQIATEIYKSLVFAFVAGMTLPMRSTLWTLWYKILSKNNQSPKRSYKKRSKKAEEE